MNKLEVLDYIKKHNKEYGGKLVTEKGFKKHFEMYLIQKHIIFYKPIIYKVVLKMVII